MKDAKLNEQFRDEVIHRLLYDVKFNAICQRAALLTVGHKIRTRKDQINWNLHVETAGFALLLQEKMK